MYEYIYIYIYSQFLLRSVIYYVLPFLLNFYNFKVLFIVEFPEFGQIFQAHLYSHSLLNAHIVIFSFILFLSFSIRAYFSYNFQNP